MAHIKSRKHAATMSTAAISLFAAALPVAAQTTEAPKKPEPAAETTLPAVKVTGSNGSEFKAENPSSVKFTQPLLDTPQTITVIKKEVLQQQVATTLAEALRNTPGVTLQLGENGNTTTGDSIFMRGFDTTNSIFVDGIRDLGNISRDVFNLDAVEVVKGPSGSDIGRGASSALHQPRLQGGAGATPRSATGSAEPAGTDSLAQAPDGRPQHVRSACACRAARCA